MKRRAFVAAAVVLLLGAAVWSAWYGNPRDKRVDAAPAPHAAGIDTSSHPRSATAAPPIAPAASIAIAPPDAASRWMARAEKAMRHYNRREYGARIGALLDLPPREAYAALVARWREGDMAAAIVAGMLADNCKHLRENRAQGVQAYRLEFNNMPPDWARYLRAIQDAEEQWREARTDACAGVGDGAGLDWDSAIAAQPDNLLARQYKAAKLDDAAAIAELRRVAAEMGNDDSAGTAWSVQRDLAAHLMYSSIPVESQEGLRLMEQLSESDILAMATLLYCYKSGCGSIQPDAERERYWQEAGAALGNHFEVATLNNAAVDANDPVSGWAWSAYELQLAEAGCLEHDEPGSTWLRQAARHAISWDNQLDPAQRVQAQQALQAIQQTWAARAQEFLGCTLD